MCIVFCSIGDQILGEATLSILSCQYQACWCPGDLRRQGISIHDMDQISQNIPSLASQELIFLLKNCEIPIHILKIFHYFSNPKFGLFIKHNFHYNPAVCLLTHWGRDKMDAISQMILSNAYSWMKMFQLRLKFHWSLFPRVQLTIFQHWFR